MKGKLYFRTIIILNSQIEILVSYSRTTIVYVNMFFPNRSFEGNVSTYVFGKPFWHYRELKSERWTSRHILCKKILNIFIGFEFRMIVKKWNMYFAQIFPRPLQQTCRLETTSFNLNTRLRVKKIKFSLILLKLM